VAAATVCQIGGSAPALKRSFPINENVLFFFERKKRFFSLPHNWMDKICLCPLKNGFCTKMHFLYIYRQTTTVHRRFSLNKPNCPMLNQLPNLPVASSVVLPLSMLTTKRGSPASPSSTYHPIHIRAPMPLQPSLIVSWRHHCVRRINPPSPLTTWTCFNIFLIAGHGTRAFLLIPILDRCLH
jgi:hypothetical protein